jgi:transposase
MSLHPTVSGEVPTPTATVARAAFPRGNPYLLLRDQLGTIFTDAQFTPLFAPCGQPAECPWRLALVTLLQFAENLSDRRAAEAVRSRIDWKYLLGLELTDPGFDASGLSEFRTRVVRRGAEERLLDTLLALCREQKLLRARGRQRTDSTHVLGAVRSLNRLECVTESLRAALNALASAAPEWLRRHADPVWLERYDRWASDDDVPQGEAKRRAHADPPHAPDGASSRSWRDRPESGGQSRPEGRRRARRRPERVRANQRNRTGAWLASRAISLPTQCLPQTIQAQIKSALTIPGS